MSRHSWQRLKIFSLAAVLCACGSGGVDIGPTIGDLEESPPVLESVDLQPQVDFEPDRQQVIDSLRDLVAITADGGGTGDELRRLADLELESSLDKRNADDPAKQQLGEQEALDAIGTYEVYLQKYPDSEANDRILYQLSRAYAVESENEKSMRAMDRIVAEYPDSRYMDEVQFRRGEYLFVNQQHEAAELAYGEVVKRYPQSIYFEKSLYKYGWSQFKQGRFEDALASFIRLLDINLKNGNIREIDFNPQLSRADQELLADLIRVVAIALLKSVLI